MSGEGRKSSDLDVEDSDGFELEDGSLVMHTEAPEVAEVAEVVEVGVVPVQSTNPVVYTTSFTHAAPRSNVVRVEGVQKQQGVIRTARQGAADVYDPMMPASHRVGSLKINTEHVAGLATEVIPGSPMLEVGDSVSEHVDPHAVAASAPTTAVAAAAPAVAASAPTKAVAAAAPVVAASGHYAVAASAPTKAVAAAAPAVAASGHYAVAASAPTKAVAAAAPAVAASAPTKAAPAMATSTPVMQSPLLAPASSPPVDYLDIIAEEGALSDGRDRVSSGAGLTERLGESNISTIPSSTSSRVRHARSDSGEGRKTDEDDGELSRLSSSGSVVSNSDSPMSRFKRFANGIFEKAQRKRKAQKPEKAASAEAASHTNPLYKHKDPEKSADSTHLNPLYRAKKSNSTTHVNPLYKPRSKRGGRGR